MNNTRFSHKISVFHGRTAPEKGNIVGYGAIINALQLKMPLPLTLALISTKNRQYKEDGWQVFTSRHQPADTLHKQLAFALKYEGVNLLFFKLLFLTIGKQQAEQLVLAEPTGQYSRKIWFLYEWLMDEQLNIKDLTLKNYVELLDPKKQFALEGTRSARHRIINNLPGTPEFCALIARTERLDEYIISDLSHKQKEILQTVHKDVLQRASAFLLLKDSKASFTIEGEDVASKRAERWGKAIGQAGTKPLSKKELFRLQQIVIESDRFVAMGFRKEGGFVGEHDRFSGKPIPDHISARWQDIENLMDGLFACEALLQKSGFDVILQAAIVAFGFIYIHPFVDGNGRLHRYLVHHILAANRFVQQGIIFPVSSAMLDKIDEYRNVLETFSQPLLDFIEWRETKDNNVEVLNETIDFYRYPDFTKHAEFLFECVDETITRIIPEEIAYLKNFDQMKRYLQDTLEMPDRTVALLIRFLEQNNGTLSQRAKSKEFKALSKAEVEEIEKKFKEVFGNAEI